jgi:hypothetical protein
VIHSIRKIEELRKTDGNFNTLINTLLESFRERFGGSAARRGAFSTARADGVVVEDLLNPRGPETPTGSTPGNPRRTRNGVHKLSYRF